MEISRGQILRLKDAYINNKESLKKVEEHIEKHGLTNEGLSDVSESFEQGWNNAFEFVFTVLNIPQSKYKEVRFERLTASEFRNLSPGDMVYIKIGEDYSVCEIKSHPKINYDADEPDWEVETNIAWSDMDSLYKLV